MLRTVDQCVGNATVSLKAPDFSGRPGKGRASLPVSELTDIEDRYYAPIRFGGGGIGLLIAFRGESARAGACE
jgi:hypothetical protein